MPLPIWVVTINKTKDNIAKLHEIRGIHHFLIKIQDFRSTNKSMQCFRCQNMKDLYVKCDGQHNTRACAKAIGANPKCTNCGGEHPANYRGCPISKKYEEKRAAIRAPSRPQVPRVDSVREFPSLPSRPQAQTPHSAAAPAPTTEAMGDLEDIMD